MPTSIPSHSGKRHVIIIYLWHELASPSHAFIPSKSTISVSSTLLINMTVMSLRQKVEKFLMFRFLTPKAYAVHTIASTYEPYWLDNFSSGVITKATNVNSLHRVKPESRRSDMITLQTTTVESRWISSCIAFSKYTKLSTTKSPSYTERTHLSEKPIHCLPQPFSSVFWAWLCSCFHWKYHVGHPFGNGGRENSRQIYEKGSIHYSFP